MKNHTIRVTPPGDVLKREEELAWLLAATAVDPTPIDSEVQDMVINRIIDSVALAIAGVTADPVVRAQAQALAQHSVLLTTYPTNGGDESDVRVDHLDVALARSTSPGRFVAPQAGPGRAEGLCRAAGLVGVGSEGVGVGQDRVDLPAFTAGACDPDFVLGGEAAGGAELFLGE
jgi:hypothetical protein